MIPERRDAGLLTSRLGEVRVGLPGEEWPEFEDRPLLGLCQINLDESPHVPDQLKDFSFLSIWMADERKCPGCLNFPHRTEGVADPRLCIRAYPSLEGLVHLPSPLAKNPFVPHGVRWERVEDQHPHDAGAFDWAEERGLTVEQAWLIMDKMPDIPDDGNSSDRAWWSKLGGWPAPIQDPIPRPLALQLGCMDEVRMQWVDGGCFYLWRRDGEGPVWDSEVQFF
jgi:hypothetical protein